MISIGLVMAIIGASVGLVIGILIFSSVEQAIECPNTDENDVCTRAKKTAWTVISILPVAMFFALFAIFGGFMRDDYDSNTIKSDINKTKTSIATVCNSKLKLILMYIGLAKVKK